jgi:hypothetical protein
MKPPPEVVLLIALRSLPFEVSAIVVAAKEVKAGPAAAKVMLELKIADVPDILMIGVLVPVSVPVKPVQSRFKHDRVLLTVTFTVPLLASMNALSEDEGTVAPPAAPEDVAHLVPTVESQVLLPPTQ